MNTPAYKETLFDLYVPIGKLHGIDPASAVVAAQSQRGQERVLVYFESNRLGASNIVTYADRCLHAAGRAAMNYPTVAKASLPASELVHAGTYDLLRQVVTSVTNAPALKEWLSDYLPMPEAV